MVRIMQNRYVIVPEIIRISFESVKIASTFTIRCTALKPFKGYWNSMNFIES